LNKQLLDREIPRYRSLSSWLKSRFGEPVRKITIDAGLSCPNRDGTIGSEGCIYCNPRGSGTGAHEQGASILSQVDRGIEALSKRYKCSKFIAYLQAFTNTYAPLSELARIYNEAMIRPEIVGMAVGTRPDCVSDRVLDLLADSARDRLIWVEYGLQSAHPETLALINRGHGSEVFFDAVKRTRDRGITVVVHLILGLPGESLEHMVETAHRVAEARVDGVKLHPLYVIKGTTLEKTYRDGGYAPLSEEEALTATLSVLEVLPPDVVVHRMTSDPHRSELVAPLWMLDRREARLRLERAMNERDFRQGSKCEDPIRRQAPPIFEDRISPVKK
jgi:uncharacterized protein